MTTPLARLVQIHKAIGHPVRLRLLAMLRGGPLCVCQMTVVVKLAASTVSEHLSELRRAGLVAERKEGRWVSYRLSDAALRQGTLDSVWPELDEDRETHADAVLLRELRRVPVDQLCRVDLELGRIDGPKLASAVAKAAKIRATEAVER
ncbi:MAG TPA: metalloregulator ArsR/SmtB family transcription factor [Thermoanaerobaculia bacterium]|jgi:DNA-binding transcriptional ArsR family regulator|nr:metalloregulator ArsR/SmtB family transcription factor [Thermoanaerobaculia bacterium]